MKNYTKKKSLVLGLFLLFGLNLMAQDNAEANDNALVLGKGLQFNFNKGDYQFRLGGMIQPQVGFNKDSTADATYSLNSRRTFFNLSGKAKKEKISFLVQTDFSLATPLLDAWVAYAPSKYLSLTFGQHLAIANNREMTFMETNLQFLERSLLSKQYSATGREFGLALASEINIGNLLILPKAAVTSGDGRNSFGSSGTDYDLGGLKYAARIDVLPFGNFTEGNDKLLADLAFEAKPKLLIGAAYSHNIGATQATGEGHGDFFLYNNLGKNQLPDYRKLYYDILFKFKGISLLAEYVIGTAKMPEIAYSDATGLNRLEQTQISEFLALGTGFNAHASYVFRKKYGIDVRYATTTREFGSNENSVIKDQQELTYGITKYVQANHLKINASLTHLTLGSNSSLIGTLLVQLVF
jgi:hypothetical protein